MAYINAEKVKKFRIKIRETFPKKEGWKISVRKEDGGPMLRSKYQPTSK